MAEVIDAEFTELPATTTPKTPAPRVRARKPGARRLPTSERSKKAYERATRALKLKANGLPWREVAAALGYKSVASVYEAVTKLLAEYDIEGDVVEYRRLELERLDIYERELMDIVRKGGRAAPRAIEVAMKVMEQRAKILGLYAAEQHEVSVNAPTFYDYERDERQDGRQKQVMALLADRDGDAGGD